MNSSRLTLGTALFLIAIGCGWLLQALGIVPSVDWLWTAGLATVGILMFVVGGLDKITVFVGPLFLVASVLSFFRQTRWIEAEVEMPVLLISAGILMAIVRDPRIAAPKWFYDLSKDEPEAKS